MPKYPRSEEPQEYTICGEVKPAGEFHADQSSPTGLVGVCKACRAESKCRNYSRSDKPQKCKRCDETKPADAFHTDKSRPAGVNGVCNTCVMAAHRLRTYGLTPETHLQMLNVQNHTCFCGKPLTVADIIDHCHITGRIRDVLCSPCNRLIGFANDRPNTLRALADNLERHQRLEAQGISQWGYVPTKE